MVKDILLYNYYQGRLTGPHMVRMKSSVRRLVYGAWVSTHVKLRINNCIYINIK